MKITALKAQIKRPERVSVFVDGKYSFSLSQSQLLELGVRLGLELDDVAVASLRKASDFGKMYERVLNYLMIRPRSVFEVQAYCRRKKFEPSDSDLIIDKLIARKYLDDAVFARAWVDNRRHGKPVSERRLRMELTQKGVASALVDQTIADNSFDELESLRQLIAKKRRQTRYQEDQKLVQYLARQGFSYGDIVREMETSLDA